MRHQRSAGGGATQGDTSVKNAIRCVYDILMTIGTCAWMEREWFNSIDSNVHRFFRGARYMDDIILLLSRSGKWNKQRFLEHLEKSECYWKPLTLEAGKKGVYLETSFQSEQTGGSSQLSHRLKNDNEEQINVWRYHHYHSGSATAPAPATAVAAATATASAFATATVTRTATVCHCNSHWKRHCHCHYLCHCHCH